MKNRVRWTGYLVYFKLEFCRLQQTVQNWEKNPVHQTLYSKLENCKNQVQINSGVEFHSHLGNFVREITKNYHSAIYIFYFVWWNFQDDIRVFKNFKRNSYILKRNSANINGLVRLGSFWSDWWNSCNWPAARDALMRKFSNCQATGASPLLRKN